jgi:hypothetical protein
MANPDHVEVVKQGAAAIRKWREDNPNVRLDLGGADLNGANLGGADLNGANLGKANLIGVGLNGANLGKANLIEADLIGADLYKANLIGAYLYVANLGKADLIGADLIGANLDEANLGKANLYWADLSDADLSKADLSEAKLAKANLAGAMLHETALARADLDGVRGVYKARGLETTRLREGDVQYFEACQRSWPERLFDWERLRVVGRLPLFGISYTALILIPIVFYGLALYNDKIDLVRAWAAQAVPSPDHPLHWLAPLLLERLHPRPIPRQSLLLLGSTILLAAGSTLYTFFSPSRIKEFSRDQWCDQIGRSLLHYWPLAWKHRYIRLTCAACYALGGVGALWVLGTKVWHTGVFIWKHSTWPGLWW